MAASPQQLAIALQPKQKRLLQAVRDRRPDAATVLGFGGSRGAAKSGGVRRIALILAVEQPGIIVWLIRRVWDDLNKDHVKPLFVEYPHLKPFWHATDKELRLPVNGGESSIFFIHAGDTGRAKRKARGPQAHYIFLEQAEEFSQEEMQQLAGSNRAPGVGPGFCKRIFTFNPGGIGTNYLRRIFHLKEYRDNENPADFMFIQGFGWDNYEWFRGLGIVSEWDFYHSPPWNHEMPLELSAGGLPLNPSHRFKVFVEQTDFGRKLYALPPSQRIGELMGSFEKFAGQYYSEVWEPSATVLPADLVGRIIQPWWRRWLATDWGFSHYAATGWGASGLLSPDQVRDFFGVETALPVRIIILYRELVCNEVPEPDLARLILALTPDPEKREIRDHWMSPDAWHPHGGGNTVVEQMEPILTHGGLPRMSRAATDRVGGWRLMYNCWASARRLRNWRGPSRFQDCAEDAPAFFVSAACPEVISAVPMLVSDNDPTIRPNGDPLDVRKMPGQVQDDVGDMVRYLLKSYLVAEPHAPQEVVAAEAYARYQDPTARAMAMLKLSAEQEDRRYIRRRRRA